MPRRLSALLLATPPRWRSRPRGRGHRPQGRLRACPSAATAISAGSVEQGERTTLCLVNLERTSRGLRRLRDNARLERAATRHSRDMVARDFFSHTSLGGATMMDRIKQAGYLGRARSYSLGENLAWGTGTLGTPLKIVDGWMHSPGHRQNILNPRFEELGVGIVPGAPGGHADGATYTTDFGARG